MAIYIVKWILTQIKVLSFVMFDWAIIRVISDQNFLNGSMNLLRDRKFPAFKNSIVEHVTKATKDSDIVSLFESLDGYIEYEALEENDPKKRAANQMTDETCENPSLKNHNITSNKSIKNTRAVTESEQRKDFPEASFLQHCKNLFAKNVASLFKIKMTSLDDRDMRKGKTREKLYFNEMYYVIFINGSTS